MVSFYYKVQSDWCLKTWNIKVTDHYITSLQFPDVALQIVAVDVSWILFSHQTNTLLFDAHATLV